MKRNNLVALVTGASSGIGLATANKLLAAGYTVYGTSRRAALPGQYPFKMMTLDVTDDASVQAAINQLMRSEGRIDLLVNNAGYGIAPAGAEESSIEQAKAIFDTNFLGMVRMTRAVLPYMRNQANGRIINIGSILGLVAFPYVALYAASKHAVAGYSQALDHELRTFGIRVSVIEPAYTKTQFEANNIQPDAKIDAYEMIRTKLTKIVTQAIAGGDTPEVVAEVVLNAARALRPKLRYTAGKAASQLQLLQRFAPSALLGKGIRKSLQLDRQSETH